MVIDEDSQFFFFLRFYSFMFREKGRDREREGEKCQCATETLMGCISHALNWGPGPQPRHVP